MILDKKKYNIAIISHWDNFNNSVQSLIDSSNKLTFIHSLDDHYKDIDQYNLIIINTSDEAKKDILVTIDNLKSPSNAILLICSHDNYQYLYNQLNSDGIFILAKPITKSQFTQALLFLSVYYERTQELNNQLLILKQKQKEDKLINRAKLLLMTNEYMSEESAHRYIEKEAMNHSLSKKEIANKIIKHYQ